MANNGRTMLVCCFLLAAGGIAAGHQPVEPGAPAALPPLDGTARAARESASRGAGPTARQIIYVDGENGDDAWDGLCQTWESGACGPKRTLRAGIEAASDGDQVLIADGVYTGPDNKNLDLLGKAITVRSAAGDPAACIIDCQGEGRGFYLGCGETAATVIEGFTIRNGRSDDGGAVYCLSDPTLIHCRITANAANYDGGGLFCYECSPTLVNCSITGNTAGRDGGGVYVCNGSPTLSLCELSANAAEHYGGGVNCTYADVTLSNCLLQNNAAMLGGGVFCVHSNPVLVNCTVFGNEAQLGGGLYCGPTSGPTLTNCILWADLPQAIYVSSGSPIVTCSDVQGGWPGSGNIDLDPMFAFPTDLRLVAGSPCIDTGNNDPVGGLPASDLEGHLRPLDGDGDGQSTADMGVYEFDPAAPPRLALSATEFLFTVPQGETQSQTLAIRNSGGGVLAWSLPIGSSWLTADPVAGESTGEIDLVTLTVRTEGLTRGTYPGALFATAPGAYDGSQTISVVLQVTSNLLVPSRYATIQSAVIAAFEHDEVIIADGVYTGSGNKEIDFRGKAITVRSASGDPSRCIIDCEGAGRGFVFRYGETNEATIGELTIRNGYAPAGGGVLCEDGSSPTLRNCVITNNTAADRGGGLSCSNSAVALFACRIVNNTAREEGGGAHLSNSAVTLQSCIIADNRVYDANGKGSAIYCSWSNPTLSNCTLSGNEAWHGGGLYCSNSSPTLANCVLWADTPPEIQVWSGTPTVTHCDVQGGWPGEGNIAADPGFAFPDEYHLSFDSPCIDAGINLPPGGLPATDVEGLPRAQDGDADGQCLTDMGAYEFHPYAPTIALSPRAFKADVRPGHSISSTFNLRNSSLGTLNWTLEWDADWLTATPVSGQSSGEIDSVELLIDTSGLEWGTYSAALRVSDPQACNSPRALPITITVMTHTLHVPSEYSTIRSALDAAVDGDQIIVADGTYRGSLNRDLDFLGKAVTLRSASGNPDSCVIDCDYDGRGFRFHSGETSAAVVDGFSIRNGRLPEAAPESAGGCILCVNGSSPTISNCVLRDCWVEGDPLLTASPPGRGGGGLACLEQSHPIVLNCIIDGCWVYGGDGGGGILCDGNSSPRLQACTIRNCTAQRGLAGKRAAGGGLACLNASCPTLVDCRITQNTAEDAGGLACYSASPSLDGCTISGNDGYFAGGLYCEHSSPVLQDCAITANTGWCASAIFCEWFSDPRLAACRIAGGAASDDSLFPFPPAILCRAGSSPSLTSCLIDNLGGLRAQCYGYPVLRNCTVSGAVISSYASTTHLHNCIVWPGQMWAYTLVQFPAQLSAAWCDIYGGQSGVQVDPGSTLSWGDGNIDADPAFVSPAGPDGDPATWEDNDLHLGAASPCIDLGDPAFVPEAGDTDFEGQYRLWQLGAGAAGRVDIGADEFAAARFADLNCDGMINAFDIDPFVLALTDPAAYAAEHPACATILADLNHDGLVNAFDIDPFVSRLTSGQRDGGSE